MNRSRTTRLAFVVGCITGMHPSIFAAAKTCTGATSNYFDLTSNWTPAPAPGPGDAALFGASGQTQIVVTAKTASQQFRFLSGAPSYTITGQDAIALTINGILN